MDREFNNKNNFLTTAFAQEWAFRDATQQELLEFKKLLQPLIRGSQLHPEKIKKQLLAKLRQDKALISVLNEALKPYSTDTQITWSLKTNKMLEIISSAEAFIQGDFISFIDSIKFAYELPNYQIKTNQNDVTVIGNSGSTIYGTSKGSFFKTVLINTYLIYSGKKYLREIDLGCKSNAWIDHTPNVHVTPLPNDLDPTSIKCNEIDFTECTYFYSDAKTPQGFSFIHSGYAFGGYRDEPRYLYPPGRLFGPEDCSSWIGKLTLEVDTVDTIDLWNRWKYEHLQKGYSLPSGWKKSFTGKLLITQLSVIKITNANQDIEPGLIWAERSFDLNKDPEMKGDGIGGHTALVVEKVKEGSHHVMTLNYKRKMPKMEGFGLKAFPIVSYVYLNPIYTGKRIFFFKVNQKMSEPTIEKKKGLMRCTLS